MKPFDESMLTAYLDDELSPEERRLVEEQLAADESLRVLLDDISTVRTMVQSLGSIEPAVDMSEQVFARIAKGTSDDSFDESIVSLPGSLKLNSNASVEPNVNSRKVFGLFALAAIAASLLFMLSTQFWDSGRIVGLSSTAKQEMPSMEARGSGSNIPESLQEKSETEIEFGSEVAMSDQDNDGSETINQLELPQAKSMLEESVAKEVEVQNAPATPPASPPANRRMLAPSGVRGGVGGGGFGGVPGGISGAGEPALAAMPLAQDPARVSPDSIEDSPAAPGNTFEFPMKKKGEEENRKSETNSLSWELQSEFQEIHDLYLVPNSQLPSEIDFFQNNKQDKLLREESLAMATKEVAGEDVYLHLPDAQPLVVRISPTTEGENLGRENTALGGVLPANGRQLAERKIEARSLKAESSSAGAKEEKQAMRIEEQERGRLRESQEGGSTGTGTNSVRWLVRQSRWREIEKQLAEKKRKVELGVTNPMRPPMVENPPSLNDDGWLLIEVQAP